MSWSFCLRRISSYYEAGSIVTVRGLAGWAAGGETPRGGRYYGSQSAHSFFAQQLHALQKMPLPGLHFPLPSWTDLSSATHVALVLLSR